MIPQKLEIIRRLENGKSQKEVVASYNIESSTVNDIKE
jgi:DNA-binding NarL/FixJ family response regulator